MQRKEFARGHNLRHALWKSRPCLGEIVLDRRALFAGRLEIWREPVELRDMEWINDLSPNTTQIGDGAVEERQDLWIGSIGLARLPQDADPHSHHGIGLQEFRIRRWDLAIRCRGRRVRSIDTDDNVEQS